MPETQGAFIPLTQGKSTLVDQADFEKFGHWNWCAAKDSDGSRFYAVHGKPQVRLHRLILNAADDQQIDHINGDSLDNRRCNLRFATTSQNAANQKINSNNPHGLKGIFRSNRLRNPWRAKIHVRGKRFNLGNHKTAKVAYAAYCKAAKEHFGEFACLK